MQCELLDRVKVFKVFQSQRSRIRDSPHKYFLRRVVIEFLLVLSGALVAVCLVGAHLPGIATTVPELFCLGSILGIFVCGLCS
jgi:hypothetical protein